MLQGQIGVVLGLRSSMKGSQCFVTIVVYWDMTFDIV